MEHKPKICSSDAFDQCTSSHSSTLKQFSLRMHITTQLPAMIHVARLLLLLLHCSGCPRHRLRLVLLLLIGILLVRLTSLSHLK